MESWQASKDLVKIVELMKLAGGGFWLFLSRRAAAFSEAGVLYKANTEFNSTVGGLAMIAYYFVWEYLFPQPFESIPLRALAVALCVPMILYRSWPAGLKRFFTPYWACAMTYGLVVFPAYMLLLNQGAMVWGMTLSATFVVLAILIYDWVSVLLMAIIGLAVAYGSYVYIDGGLFVAARYSEGVPVYIFAALSGIVFSYTGATAKESRLKDYEAVGRNIAHELRTPLVSLKALSSGMTQYLPELIMSYSSARKEGAPRPRISESKLRSIQAAPSILNEEIRQAHLIIDMLLVSTGATDSAYGALKRISALSIVEDALARYPFKSSREHELVSIHGCSDFDIMGTQIIVVHILFNLIKNAIYSVLSAGKGSVSICLAPGGRRNCIEIKDTGLGMSRRERRRVFEQFYTTKPLGQGSGVGLAFCQREMRRMGGDIKLIAEDKEYTNVVLEFPVVNNNDN